MQNISEITLDRAYNPRPGDNDAVVLLNRGQLARAISVSPRTVDNLQRRRVIPFIRLSVRCIRFHLPTVIAALRKFEIREAGHR
jgi:hypothetical protein